ncbi:MAG: polyphosphate kinase 2, partial [Bacteroidia bacterium]
MEKTQTQSKPKFTGEDFNSVSTRQELVDLAKTKEIDLKKIVDKIEYEAELKELQIELVNLQKFVQKNNLRVAILFEGRDASGKGGSIKRFIEHLNPRSSRVVALPKPTEIERGQWYFRRYIKQLPNPGEMVFFDRSWYNRAVVEPAMGFCNKEQYEQFIVQVPEFEHMLYEDGVILIKFWFSVSKDEQKKRFDSRLENPLKVWKYSPVDMKGQELW